MSNIQRGLELFVQFIFRPRSKIFRTIGFPKSIPPRARVSTFDPLNPRWTLDIDYWILDIEKRLLPVHSHDLRMKRSDRFYQFGLGGHYLVDVFVSEWRFIQASTN